MTAIKDILKQTSKLVFGKEHLLKQLRAGKVQEIIISSNFQDKESIINLAKLSDTKVTKVKQTNEELGALCKKPYQIAMIGLKKE